MGTRIVVGLDGSSHARRAFEYAIEEAHRRGEADIEVVMAYPLLLGYPAIEYGTVAPPRDALEQAVREQLAAEVDAIGPDVPVRQRIAEGSPGYVLVDASRDADLVVVGSRGLGGFRSLLLGSTSHQVVSHAHCPVVVVPARVDGDDGDADGSGGDD